MAETKSVNVSGYCDYKGHHSIRATYAKILIAGNPIAQQKLMSCSCNHSDECSMGNTCPIIQTAKQDTTW